MSSKVLKVLLLLFNKKDGSTHLFRNIIIIILAPIVAIIFLIASLFSDGINFNHQLVNSLYDGHQITGLTNEQDVFIKDIEESLRYIEYNIQLINNDVQLVGLLNDYQIKGYFIGLSFTNEKINLNNEEALRWVKSFTITENTEIDNADNGNKKVYPTTLHSYIYSSLKNEFHLTLTSQTTSTMEKVYSFLIGNSGNPVTTLTKEEINQILQTMPLNVTKLRKDIVLQAIDAVGKIPYYWGGTAILPGYDGNDFGTITTPDEKGRNRKGLDCSHFVDWVYWTVMGNNLGNTNTTGQIEMCHQINASELLPGDLAFLMNKNGQTTHVGIYVGMNEKGERVWVHENANDNNVAVNTVSYWSGYYRLKIMDGK